MKVKGIATYTVSPFEQKVMAGYVKGAWKKFQGKAGRFLRDAALPLGLGAGTVYTANSISEEMAKSHRY